MSKLREFIRQTIREMEDDDLEEISTTGGIAGYNTPRAFKKTTGNNPDEESDTAFVKHINRGTGYSKVKEGALSENRWLELKREESSPNRKIGVGIRELRSQLEEMEKFVSWYGRIKNESDLQPENYWKRTQRHLSEIGDRIKTLSERIKHLSK